MTLCQEQVWEHVRSFLAPERPPVQLDEMEYRLWLVGNSHILRVRQSCKFWWTSPRWPSILWHIKLAVRIFRLDCLSIESEEWLTQDEKQYRISESLNGTTLAIAKALKGQSFAWLQPSSSSGSSIRTDAGGCSGMIPFIHPDGHERWPRDPSGHQKHHTL